MKKIFLVWSLILIMLVAFTPFSVQADSFRFGMVANKATLKAGDSVTLTLSVNDIDAGELGINTVEGKLSYDSSVFEEVTDSNITSSNGWSITYNSEEKKFLGVLLKTGTKNDQEIGKINLKVKNSAKAENTTIKITNIATNNGSELIKDSNKSVTLKVQKAEGSNNNNSSSNNNKSNSNNKSSKNSKSSNSTESKTTTTKKATETKKKVKLPYTGSQNIIVAVIAMLLVSIFTYIKYKNYKKLKIKN